MYTQKKSIENSHIVRERDRRRFRELLAVFSLGVPIGLFLLLFTWQNLEVIRLGHEATRLQKARKDMEAANKSLQLQLDRMTALDEVEQRATALGFASTDPRVIVMVAPVQSVGAPAPQAAPLTQSVDGTAVTPASIFPAAIPAAVSLPAGARR
jgi:hypothetical protein